MTEYVVVKAPRLKRDYVGKTVRLTRGVRTQQVTIPAGTIMKVEHYTSGRRAAHLKAPTCSCCGVSPIVSGMRDGFEFVELLYGA